jgi:hypothetical protein
LALIEIGQPRLHGVSGNGEQGAGQRRFSDAAFLRHERHYDGHGHGPPRFPSYPASPQHRQGDFAENCFGAMTAFMPLAASPDLGIAPLAASNAC